MSEALGEQVARRLRQAMFAADMWDLPAGIDGTLADLAIEEVQAYAQRDPAGVLGLLGLNTREGIYFDPPRYGDARPEVTLGSGKSSHPTVAKYEHPCLVVVLPSGTRNEGGGVSGYGELEGGIRVGPPTACLTPPPRRTSPKHCARCGKDLDGLYLDAAEGPCCSYECSAALKDPAGELRRLLGRLG